jgi:CHAT domain-containing protein/Flp pilus assembly protein TadD
MPRLPLLLVPLLAVFALTVRVHADDKKDRLIKDYKEIQQKKQQGDFDGAIEQCEQVLRQARKDFGANHPDTATLTNELGLLYLGTARFDAAEERLKEALELRRNLKPPNRIALAKSLGNLAELYRLRDDYAHAEPLQREGLTLLESELAKATATKARSELEEQLANLSLNLGKVYELMGEFDKAEARYRRSLELMDSDPDGHAHFRAHALNNLGWLYHLTQDYKKAEPNIRQALKIRQKLGAESLDVAESLNNLAMLYHSTQRYEEAKPLFESSLKIMMARLGPGHQRVATVENNLAGLLRSMGDVAGAEQGFRKSLDILTRIHGEEHPEVATLLVNLAALHAASGRWEVAAGEMDRARRCLRLHVSRVLSSQSETEQLAFLQNKDQRWLHAALTLGVSKNGDAEIAERSAAWVLNGKMVGLQALAQRPVLARDSQDPHTRDLLASLRQEREKLASLAFSAPAAGQEAQRKALWEATAKRERDLSRQLGQALGGIATRDAWVEPAAVRREVAPDAVLVEFARFGGVDFAAKGTEFKRLPPRYAAWVIPGQGPIRVVDLGDAKTIDAAVQGYQDEINAFIKLLKKGSITRTQEKESEQRVMKPLQQLASLVLEPLKIDSAKRWIISPDAALWLVPWAALPVGEHFAVEDHPISLVATGRDLLPRSDSAATAPVIFASVDYGKIPEKNPPRPLFGDLAFSLAEADEIAPRLKTYTGMSPEVFTNAKATEKAFRSLHSPRVLVLSTHGFVRNDKTAGSRNPLLQCGLALAGINQRGQSGRKADNDGLLLGYEILDVDLRGTELVMMSACETALGEVRTSGEGVLSLQYAFQLAGARSVVGTLWEVPDEATAMMSRDFFAQLADGKLDKAEALRAAQLARIKGRRDLRRSTHPFFWAALTLTGQWK